MAAVQSWERGALSPSRLAPDFGGPECQREEETQVKDSREPWKALEHQRGWVFGRVIR